MAELADMRLQIGAIRRELDRERIQLHDDSAALDEDNRLLEQFGPDSDQHPGLGAERDGLVTAVASDQESVTGTEKQLADARDAYDTAVAAEPPIWADAGELPLLLLPVRLEAVFSRVAGAAQLLLRVYPDDVHVDAHEEGLTEAELDAGKAYWAAAGAHGASDADKAAAWAVLLERLGLSRAAWTREALRPGSPAPQTRADTWTRAPHTTLLPDRFVFSAYTEVASNDYQLAWRHEGADIPDELKVGFSPPGADVERLDRLPYDKDAGWLVDFQAAVDNGMALQVPLPDPDVSYALLTAVGVSAGIDAQASGARWQTTLQAHQFGSGLAFLPVGTPTNNTPASRSGWRSRPEPRPPELVDQQLATYKPGGDQRAARAARAFGIDGSTALAAAPEAIGEEDALPDERDLQSLHDAFGWFFNESLLIRRYPADEKARDDRVLPPKVPKLLDHYRQNVRSRGTLPTLRVGRQPYGLLPAGSLDLWRGDDPDARLLEHLRSLTSTIENGIFLAPRVGVAEDEDSTILDLLSRVPASQRIVDTQTRPVDLTGERNHRPPNAVLGSVPSHSRADTFDLPDDSDRPPRSISEEPPDDLKQVLAGLPLTKLLDNARKRRAAREQDAQADIGNLEQEQQDLRAKLEPFADDPRPRSYYGMALGMLNELDMWILGIGSTPDPDQPEEEGFLPDALDRSVAMVEAMVKVEPAAAENLPRVDRLMLEGLDTVAHRIDAWITSLAAARLEALRDERPNGLRTGAYGWLADVRRRPGPRSAERRLHRRAVPAPRDHCGGAALRMARPHRPPRTRRQPHFGARPRRALSLA